MNEGVLGLLQVISGLVASFGALVVAFVASDSGRRLRGSVRRNSAGSRLNRGTRSSTTFAGVKSITATMGLT